MELLILWRQNLNSDLEALGVSGISKLSPAPAVSLVCASPLKKVWSKQKIEKKSAFILYF